MEIDKLGIYRYLWHWWKSVDQYLVISLCILCFLSLMLVTTSGSAVAARIGVQESYFATRHVLYVILAILTSFAVSFLNKNLLKRAAICGFIISILLLIVVKLYGYEVKGAKRWINMGGISMQPSEFMKPFFLVVTGWLLSTMKLSFHKTSSGLDNRKLFEIELNNQIDNYNSVVLLIVLALYSLVALLLVLQPDLGMLIMMSASLGLQLFVAGIPILWFCVAVFMGLSCVFVTYKIFPHVRQRIDVFLDPSIDDNYQVIKSLMAFKKGGLYGKGPGEGVVKQVLPDSHTDFIFAVAGEELGALVCIFIMLVFGFIIVRGFLKLRYEQDRYVVLAASGLLAQLAFQAVVNMGVSVNLLPTKGVTLPFISYGGSSTLAVALTAGMLLSFTKRKTNLTKYKLQNIEI